MIFFSKTYFRSRRIHLKRFQSDSGGLKIRNRVHKILLQKKLHFGTIKKNNCYIYICNFKKKYIIISPFVPSQTYSNLKEYPYAVINFTDDVKIFSDCILGKKKFKIKPTKKIKSFYLQETLSYFELDSRVKSSLFVAWLTGFVLQSVVVTLFKFAAFTLFEHILEFVEFCIKQYVYCDSNVFISSVFWGVLGRSLQR